MDKGPVTLKEKPVIGISACGFNAPLRYNGRSMDFIKAIGREKGDFRWCPVCPETAAGLGVPRDPIHLVGQDGRAIWQGEGKIVSRNGHDVTAVMLAAAQESLATLRRAGAKVFIYMDGSPSCGVYRTTLRKRSRGKPPGVFGALLDDEGFFLIPALEMQSPLKWWDWRRRMLAYLWLQEVPLKTRGDLYEAWYRLKFLCQELDDPWAREQGRYLAALKGRLEPEVAEQFRREVGDVLRRPSTLKRITGSLWKNYSHHKKITGRPVPDIQDPSVLRNVTTIARELMIMEREATEEGILFGTAPVTLRKKRSDKDKVEADFHDSADSE